MEAECVLIFPLDLRGRPRGYVECHRSSLSQHNTENRLIVLLTDRDGPDFYRRRSRMSEPADMTGIRNLLSTLVVLPVDRP